MIKLYHILIILAAILFNAAVVFSQPDTVIKQGFNSEVQFEQVISGKLTELNGKYKIRVTKTTYEPGGFIGEHHHAGPGVRLVLSGELEYVQPDTTRTFHEGDYFYESGNITHTAYNKTDKPVVILNFEILPADWKGSSATVPDKK